MKLSSLHSKRLIASLAGTAALPLSIAAKPPFRTVGAAYNGGVLVSTNQTVSPIGYVRETRGSRPKDLALSPDGRTLAVLTHVGARLFTSAGTPIASLPFHPGPLGIAWSPDGNAVYASEENGLVQTLVRSGDDWIKGASIHVSSTVSHGAGSSGATSGHTNSPNGTTLVPLPETTGDPDVAGIAVSPDGLRLYVALSVRNAVAVVDVQSGQTVGLVKVGICPYRLLLSPDGRDLFVANRGGHPALAGEPWQDSAGSRVRIDRRTDATLRGSISFINTDTLHVQTIDAGRQPSAFALTRNGEILYAANADGDSVSAIDTRTRRITATFTVRPARDTGFGQMPTGLALSDDQTRLYVTCGGANAVALIPLNMRPTPQAVGYLPTGWFPIAIAQRGGRLYVASSKGIGSRNANKDGNFNAHASVGTVQFMAPADYKNVRDLTERVAANNHWGQPEPPARPNIAAAPIPARIGEPSLFKHVVYIIKENHTYDLDLGDMPEGEGDKKLCLFGEQITPNLHALARQFVLLDNTYTSGTNSADGHQWCDSAVCNAYREQNYSADVRSYPFDGGDPLSASPGGFLWTDASQHKTTLRIYGEFVNQPKVADPATGKEPSWTQLWNDYKSGGHRYRVTAGTTNATVRPFLRAGFIGFPEIVSDQARADIFLSDLKRFEAAKSMPSLCMMLLPNNHTSGTHPGMPTPRAAVADNDLAVGRIVEGISHSRFWKDTLILIIEDDSQFGLDHVDGHRTTAYCISPYTRRGAVVHNMYNHTSLLRTIELVLGLPAMTRFDHTATPMTACFTSKLDMHPYTHLNNNVRLDEMNPSLAALQGETRRLALASQKQDWAQPDRADAATVAQAVWRSLRGTPFPARSFHPNLDHDN